MHRTQLTLFPLQDFDPFLADSPLTPFLSGEISVYDNETPEVVAVKIWAIAHPHTIYHRWHLYINQDQSPVSIVNKLLRKLGHTPTQIAIVRCLHTSGRKRVYRID